MLYGTIIAFQSAPRNEAAIVDSKNKRLEQCPIALVKWNIEGHAIAIGRRRHCALNLAVKLIASAAGTVSGDLLDFFLAGFLA